MGFIPSTASTTPRIASFVVRRERTSWQLWTPDSQGIAAAFASLSGFKFSQETGDCFGRDEDMFPAKSRHISRLSLGTNGVCPYEASVG